MSILVYGANGYTGRLVVKAAAEQKLSIIVAGRSEKPVQLLATTSGFESRVFNLNDAETLKKQLNGIQAAGSRTPLNAWILLNV